MDALRDCFLDSIKYQTYIDDIYVHLTLPYLRDELGFTGWYFDQIKNYIDTFIARSNITITKINKQTGIVESITVQPMCTWRLKANKSFSKAYNLPYISPPDLTVKFIQK